MMNKELLYEINRYRNLMGLDKKILTEGRVLNSVKNFITDLFNPQITPSGVTRRLTTSPRGNGFSFTIGSNRYVFDSLEYNQINQFLQNTIQDLSPSTKSKLIKILRDLGKIDSKKIYDDFVDQMVASGGDEENFLKNLTLLRKEPNSRGVEKGLKPALNEMLPNDPEFVDEIYTVVNRKLDDYNAGKLVKKEGKLIENTLVDLIDFKNLLPLTTEELMKLKNNTIYQKFLAWTKNFPNLVTETKRLMKNLNQSTDILEKQELEKLLAINMQKIYSYKTDIKKYMIDFEESLANTNDTELKQVYQKIQKVKEKNPEKSWYYLPYTVSKLDKVYEVFKTSLKEALSLETSLLKLTNLPRLAANMVKTFKKRLGIHVQDAVSEADKNTGTFLNLYLTGSGRGLPGLPKANSDGTLPIDFYKKLREKYGYNAALSSYILEVVLKGMKWKFYYFILSAVLPKIAFEIISSEEEMKCLGELIDFMKKIEVYDTGELFNLLDDPEQRKIFPPCVLELQKNSKLIKFIHFISVADYMCSPTSEEGNYFWPQLKESIKKTNFWSGTAFIPGFWDDTYDLFQLTLKLIRQSDMSGPAIKRVEENDPRVKVTPPKEFSVDTAQQSNVSKTEEIYGVEQLLQEFPFLNDVDYTWTLNTDGTFNLYSTTQKYNYTVEMIDGKPHVTYITPEGKDKISQDPPFELKSK